MKRRYEIKLVVPHNEIQLANDLTALGYKQTWVTFDGIELIQQSPSKRKKSK